MLEADIDTSPAAKKPNGDYSSAIYSRNMRISRTLYWFAWMIEVFAVVTGLAISLLVGIDTFQKNKQISGIGGVTNYVNVIIASLPFVMVSIVELAKIPTAQAMYATKHFAWKLIFTLLLVFLALITFETALNGFERNFRNINYQVTELHQQRSALRDRYDVLLAQNERDRVLTREDILNNFDRQNSVLIEKRDSELKSITDQEAMLQSDASKQVIAQLQDSLSGLKNRRQQLLNERDREILSLNGQRSEFAERAEREAESRRELVRIELQKKEIELRQTREKFEAERSDAFFTRGAIEAEYAPRIEVLESEIRELSRNLSSVFATELQLEASEALSKQISQLRSEYAAQLEAIDTEIGLKNQEIATALGALQADSSSDRKRLLVERSRIQNQYDEDLRVLDARKSEDLTNLKSAEARILANEGELRELDAQIGELASKINAKAQDNQVYRLAKMFDSDAETVADVSPNLVNAVGKIWFGSLALVIALTGIALALASEVVKDPANTEYDAQDKKKRSSIRALRSLAAALNRYARQLRRRPFTVKNVIQEVPVDRVVFQDRVREVIKKEVVHVPIFTNDEKLISEQHS